MIMKFLTKFITKKQHKEKMKSESPWFELKDSTAEDVHDRYSWNSAFIKKLCADGYGKITDPENDVMLKWELNEEKKKVQQLLEKERETKRNSNEPWVEVIGDKPTEDNKIELTLDWNKAFIKYLKNNGFNGRTEDELIERWLTSLTQEVLFSSDEYE